MTAVFLTHTAWFGICPIYAGFSNDRPGPVLMPRHWLLIPLMLLSQAAYWLCTTSQDRTILVTGVLVDPICLELP